MPTSLGALNLAELPWLQAVDLPFSDLSLDGPEFWLADVSRAADAGAPFSALLDPGELARANRFRFEHDRTAFVIRRGLVRCLLGLRLACAPSEVVFRVGPQGKPQLQPPSELQFNTSHSGQWVLIGVVRGREIGVDIEGIRPSSDLAGLAAMTLAVEELAWFRSLSPSEQVTAFYRFWTRKEAVLKAQGSGLSIDPRDVRVDALDAGESAEGHGSIPFAGASFRIRSFGPAPGYAGAVALSI